MLVNPRQSVATYTVYHLEIEKIDDYSKREDVIHSIQNELFHFVQQFHFDTFLYEHHVAFVVMVGRMIASYKKANKAAHCVQWLGAFRSLKASR